MDTVERGEMVEKELDAFITRRSRNGESTRDEEDALWKASVERDKKRRRRQNVAAWFSHFCLMADNHAALAESYRERAEQLCCEEGEA